MALLEAAACGRPIVTTDVPGCNDLIEDGVSGLLVPHNDWMKLADAIEALAASAALRSRFGAAARRKVEAEFGQQDVVERTFALYRKGIAEFGPGSDLGPGSVGS